MDIFDKTCEFIQKRFVAFFPLIIPLFLMILKNLILHIMRAIYLSNLLVDYVYMQLAFYVYAIVATSHKRPITGSESGRPLKKDEITFLFITAGGTLLAYVFIIWVAHQGSDGIKLILSPFVLCSVIFPRYFINKSEEHKKYKISRKK